MVCHCWLAQQWESQVARTAGQASSGTRPIRISQLGFLSRFDENDFFRNPYHAAELV
jgi:hypothetical protein